MKIFLCALLGLAAILSTASGENLKVGEICVKKTNGVYLRGARTIRRETKLTTPDACIRKCARYKKINRRTRKPIYCKAALILLNSRTKRKYCQLLSSNTETNKRTRVVKGNPKNVLQEILKQCPGPVPAIKTMANDLEVNNKERWNEWGQWSPCTKTCGRGTKTRTRSCQQGCKVQEAGERDTCEIRACPTRASRISNGGAISVSNSNGGDLVARQLPSNQWEEWGGWSNCPQYCSGETQRNRKCQGYGCQGDSVQKDQCACPQWQPWGSWGSCSATCGGGTKQRQRQCSMPGVCQGDSVQNELCNFEKPCAEWMPWTQFGACSVSCGAGMQRRSRVCSEIGLCLGERNEERSCDSGPCPSWLEWGPWSSCSATCDGGFKTRDRGCSHNTLCLGDSSESLDCGMAPCPQWNDWQSWTSCTATCGTAAQKERKRTCSYGGFQCNGGMKASYQQSQCPNQPCPVWTRWSSWSKCNKQCGGGQKQRVRNCQYGQDCQGDRNQKGKCGNLACAAWEEWGSWTQCSQTCGGGQVQRDRSCKGYGQCSGDKSTYNQCNTQSCATWSQWSPWSECPVSCGEGVVSRQRTCQNGDSCVGDSAENKPCDSGPCPQWADWAPWTQCSVTCGSGMLSRQRDCQYGTQCSGGDGYGEQKCDMGPCPQWSPWESWTECSATCGGGFKDRVRDCEGGDAGLDCPGDDFDEAECNNNPCPEWKDWEPWQGCSVTCGRGTKGRKRTCQYGSPCPGGQNSAYGEESCDAGPCPSWSPWTQWSQCSRTCGPGGKTRTRECMNGNNCPGKDLEQQNCNEQTCAAWSDWAGWTQCSVTCGNGQKQRSRSCGGGRGAQCDGTARDSQQCQMPSCPPACVWENWMAWGPCSSSCGPGTQNRARKCSCYAGCPRSEGGPMESRTCQSSPCRDQAGNSYVPDPNNPAHAAFFKSRSRHG